jgi:hypothetical protein
MDMNGRKPAFRIVAASTPAAAVPAVDPIYAAIQVHHQALRGHIDAVRVEFAYEENAGCRRDMNAEQLREHDVLGTVTAAAANQLEETSVGLVTVKPTTLAGIGAVCRYMKSLLGDGTPGLLVDNEFDDVEAGMGVFCDTIAAAIEAGIREAYS